MLLELVDWIYNTTENWMWFNHSNYISTQQYKVEIQMYKHDM